MLVDPCVTTEPFNSAHELYEGVQEFAIEYGGGGAAPRDPLVTRAEFVDEVVYVGMVGHVVGLRYPRKDGEDDMNNKGYVSLYGRIES